MADIKHTTLQKVIGVLENLRSNEASAVLEELKESYWHTRSEKAYMLVAFIPEDTLLPELQRILQTINTTLSDLSVHKEVIPSVHPKKGARLFVFRSSQSSKNLWDKIRMEFHGLKISSFLVEIGMPVSQSCFSEEGWKKVCKLTSFS